MSNPSQESSSSPSAVSNRRMEVIVAVATFLLGALVVYDSLRLGTGWGDEGPKAGYFPFYIGLIICIGSIVNLVMGLRDKDAGSFVSKAQAADVLRVLLPMIAFAGLIGVLGMYLAGAIYIAFFMRWVGKYQWFKTACVSIGTIVAFFVVFELWFKVPLIKGPLEALLGLN
jgi:putative tricarboxylic transport membrane protein